MAFQSGEPWSPPRLSHGDKDAITAIKLLTGDFCLNSYLWWWKFQSKCFGFCLYYCVYITWCVCEREIDIVQSWRICGFLSIGESIHDSKSHYRLWPNRDPCTILIISLMSVFIIAVEFELFSLSKCLFNSTTNYNSTNIWLCMCCVVFVMRWYFMP